MGKECTWNLPVRKEHVWELQAGHQKVRTCLFWSFLIHCEVYIYPIVKGWTESTEAWIVPSDWALRAGGGVIWIVLWKAISLLGVWHAVRRSKKFSVISSYLLGGIPPRILNPPPEKHPKYKKHEKIRVPTVMEKSWKMTGHGKVMEKSWKIIGHGKVMDFRRSWKKSSKTQIWTNLFCRFCRTSCLWNTDLTTLLTKVFTMKDTATLCKLGHTMK